MHEFQFSQREYAVVTLRKETFTLGVKLMIGENFHGMKLRVKIHTVKLGVKNNIHGLKLIRLFRNQSRHENNFASFVYLRYRRLSLSGQKECLIAGYEKSVKAHQRQEEGKFLIPRK